uniref:Retrotransposon Copia-like N-terminal domain-containing protein n=1 Tax=Cannabis sativa TaxID=3483 RepID=A0A803QJT5_CANSA
MDSNVQPYFDEAQNPYFLSSCDHPGASLVSKILTWCENYNSWHRAMRVALVARNKLKFVNRKLPAPEEDDDNFKLWNCCNNTMISWIFHAISSEIAESVMYMDNATHI